MIPFAKPYFGEEEINALKKVICSGWVTQGPKIKEFEDAFAKYTGSKYACAVSSCTAALHLALLAAGIKPGNIVVTVSHSFIATANSIRHCMAEPAFIDIEPDTYNISAQALKKFFEKECEERKGGIYYKKVKEITRGESPLTVLDKKQKEFGRVSAILAVHQIGMPCDLRTILEISKKYNICVVEDAACAIGSKVSLNNGKDFEKIGKPHGDIACFSFYPRKIITTGDGGMIATNNRKYDEKMRVLRQHSMSMSAAQRHKMKKAVVEKYLSTGYNYRMTDIQGAIGIEQLKKIPEILKKRREANKIYRECLKGVGWLRLQNEPVYAISNWQSYAARILKDSPFSRDELMQRLLAKGVSVRAGVMNAHQERPYLNSRFYLPESEKARSEVMLLPFYSGLGKDEIEKIARIIKNV